MREVSIAADPTVSQPGHPATDDPQASLRTELVGQLAAAQLALETAIAELSASGGDLATLSASRAQLSSLVGLRQQISFANGPALANLRADAAAASSSASALAQQAGDSASSSAGAGSITRAQAARQAIESVGHDLFERRVLDPYLRFSSADDEAEYRKREQERQEAYERARALQTPDGDRLALQIEKDQLHDAGEHGAARSPEFSAMNEKLAQATKDLTISESRTNAQDAPAKPAGEVNKPGQSSDSMDDILAALKAAGVQTTDVTRTEGHGLSVATRSTPNQGPQLS